jgi:hypothetical protein
MGSISYISGVYYQHNLYLNMIHILAGDATNASMHLRELLRRFGMRYTWAFYLNEYYYCGAYMICRGLLIPFIFTFYWACDSTGPFFMILYPPHVL